MANRNPWPDGSSKYLGVTLKQYFNRPTTPKKWKAQIKNGARRRFKTFPFTPNGEMAAAKQYDEWAKEIFGEFANLNFK